jgi:ketosteroid isomerase-like protein
MIVSVELRDLIVQEDRACALTHYALRAPDGRAFQSDVAEIFSVRSDRIESFAIYFDSSPFPR